MHHKIHRIVSTFFSPLSHTARFVITMATQFQCRQWQIIMATTQTANCYTLNANRSARRSLKRLRRTIPAMASARACRIDDQISVTLTYCWHVKTTLDFSHRYITLWPRTTCTYLDHLFLSLSPGSVCLSLLLLPGYVS